MLLAVLDEKNFTAFFLKKTWDRKINKNHLIFKHLKKKIQIKNVINIKIEIH